MTYRIITDISLALKHLQQGELVAFPTETVYGLGADARNPQAIQKVFQVKGRPADHPLIVHLASIDQLTLWARDIPESALILAQNFWPGPLTMILHKHNSVSPLITGGQETIGVRIPNHPLTLQLLTEFGSGLVGPSANKYGRVSPTTAQHVATDLDTEVAAILDGGACTIGIESTIIYLVADTPVIMRQGAITAEQISTVLGYEVKVNTATNKSVRTSGSHASHYAPVTPMYLVPKADLLTTVNNYINKNKAVSVISFQPKPASLATNTYWQQLSSDPKLYAQNLYANLRAHDQLHNSAILIEQVADNIEWAAITDRLLRASTK